MTAPFEKANISQAASLGNFWVSGTDCDLVASRRSDTLLVTFDNLASIDERSEARPWGPWLGARAEALDYSILGVQSHHKDWYRSAEPSEQITALQANGFFDDFENIVFIGASMGGFAALSFAGLVPRAKVLAFSPQSTLNREIAPFEKRYPYPYRKFDWQKPDYLDAAEHVADVSSGHIFFDPKIVEDKMHAKRLETPALAQVSIPYAGHTLIRVLVKAGALEHLLQTYPATGAIDAKFYNLLRNKRDNEHWAKPFLSDVVARGNSRLTRHACEIMFEKHNHRFARRFRRQLIASATPKPVQAADRQPAPDHKMRGANPVANKEFVIEAFANACQHPVTLVQVGANGRGKSDPVYPYLASGDWQGIIVEPHPHNFSQLSSLHSERPNLKLSNVAISNAPGESKLFHLSERSKGKYPQVLHGHASFDRKRIVKAVKRVCRRTDIEFQAGDIVHTTVTAQRLDNVLDGANIPQVDILVIDADGHEIQVLDSFDPAALALKMVIVECDGPDKQRDKEITTRLSWAGLTVVRLSNDLVGVQKGLIQVPLEDVFSFLETS